MNNKEELKMYQEALVFAKDEKQELDMMEHIRHLRARICEGNAHDK